MPWRDDFLQPLEEERFTEGERLRIRLNTERGVVVDFVVQYETPSAERPEEHLAVVRYDGSHQRPHRDILDTKGRTARTTWLAEHLTQGEAVKFAIAEIKANWRRYRQDFYLRSRP